MYEITQITVDPTQNRNLILYDGSVLRMTMIFKPMQYGWFATLVYGTSFTINNIRIVNSPNILQQWRNLIPFGLACYSTQNREPMQQQDFIAGNSKLYILDHAEVEAFTDLLNA